MTKIILLVLAIFLSGCATTYKTREDLMKSPKTIKKTFTTPMNYQKAFRTLTPMTRRCLQESVAGNVRRTEENLDTDKKIAEIDYINNNAFWGEDYWGVYIIRQVDENKSELTTYHMVGAVGNADNSEYIKGWLEGKTKCPL